MQFTADLIDDYENDTVDRKRDASSVEGIVHDICAFANTHGGFVIVGVDDDDAVVGVDDFQKAEAKISDAVSTRTKPVYVPNYLRFTHQPSGKELLIVQVNYFQGAEPLRVKRKGKSDWDVYERYGSLSKRVDDAVRIAQMTAERRGRNTIDQQPSKVSVDKLDRQLLSDKLADVDLKATDAVLRSIEVAAPAGQKLQATNAGLLLFGEDPTRTFGDARIRCARYAGVDKATRTSSRELEQIPLLRAVEEAERFIAEHTGEFDHQLRGLRQQRLPHYSSRVIRELLVNAVAHADYQQTTPFAVQIFSDRLEITSPGRFPAGITEAAIHNGISQPRNRAVVNILRRLNYVEQSGSAWTKVLDEERQYAYPRPTWAEGGLNVRVTLPVHPRALGVPSADTKPKRTRKTAEERRSEILAFVGDQERAPADIAAAIGLGVRPLRRYLAELLESGDLVDNGEPETSPRRRLRRAN